MGPELTLVQVLASVGSPIGIAGLFIFWTYKSYQHMQKKLDEVQNGQRAKLEELSESSIRAIVQNSGSLDKNSEALVQFREVLDGVECIRANRRKDG